MDTNFLILQAINLKDNVLLTERKCLFGQRNLSAELTDLQHVDHVLVVVVDDRPAALVLPSIKLHRLQSAAYSATLEDGNLDILHSSGEIISCGGASHSFKQWTVRGRERPWFKIYRRPLLLLCWLL